MARGASVKLSPADRRAEDIGVMPVVISELKLGNVERQTLCADFVKRANHAMFQDRPKAFNRIRVDRANNIMLGALALGVINDAMRIAIVKATISGIVVCAEQANAIGYGFFDECFNRQVRDNRQRLWATLVAKTTR